MSPLERAIHGRINLSLGADRIMTTTTPSLRVRNRYRPRIEALEDRSVPAVTHSVIGTTLTLRGDAGRNVIVINDNGANQGANLTVTADGAPIVVPTFINTIDINTFNGNDQVTYNLTGSLIGGFRNLNCILGRGDDQMFVNFNNNSLLRNLFGPGSTFNVSTQGSDGNDTIRYNLAGTSVSQFSTLNLAANGQLGNDRIFVTQTGLVSGAVSADVRGGGGNDRFDLFFQAFQGSTGSYGLMELRGDGGGDNIRFRILTPANFGNVDARIDGGPGAVFGLLSARNTCERTSNIITRRCNPDRIVT